MSGVRFVSWYAGKIVAAFLGIAVAVYIMAWINIGSNAVSFMSLLKAIVPAMAPFLLLSILAYAAGYCPAGSTDRLYIRMMMCAFTLVCIFFVSHSVDYSIGEIMIDGTTGSYAKDTAVNLDLTRLSMVLIVFPVTALIDAVLEYRENRGRV